MYSIYFGQFAKNISKHVKCNIWGIINTRECSCKSIRFGLLFIYIYLFYKYKVSIWKTHLICDKTYALKERFTLQNKNMIHPWKGLFFHSKRWQAGKSQAIPCYVLKSSKRLSLSVGSIMHKNHAAMPSSVTWESNSASIHH